MGRGIISSIINKNMSSNSQKIKLPKSVYVIFICTIIVNALSTYVIVEYVLK